MPLNRLNREQYFASTTDLGYNLIIASAGTGKTSTIVARIAYLLKNGVKPENILLLTFTNKASIEMIERLSRYFDRKITKKIVAGTFHSVSYKILKERKKVVLKHPKELKVLLNSLLEKRKFPDSEEGVPYTASYLYDIYSLFQNQSPNISFAKWIEEKNQTQEFFTPIYEDVILEFEDLKKKFGYLDFNDLLLEMIKLSKEESFKFEEILVDEYQDTNPLQNSLIEAFNSKSLFCVGDYDQSIYAFNGSDIKIIGSFTKKYRDAKLFSLNKNYRSSKEILSLANRVIEFNERIYPKKLEVTRVGNFPPPQLLIYETLEEQYRAISYKIKNSLTPREEIAVIFRNNSSADGIEANLRELGVNAKRRGGVSFFDAKEVKALLDIFVFLDNPKDMMAFIHILEYAKGVGEVFAKDIFDALYNLGGGDVIKGLLNPLDSVKNPFKRVVNFQLGLFDDFIEFGSVAKFKTLGFDDNFLGNRLLKHPKMNEELAIFLYSIYTLIKKTKNLKKPSSILKEIINSALFKFITQFLAKNRAKLKDGTVDKKLQKEAEERIDIKAFLLHKLSLKYQEANTFINAMVLGSNELTEGEGVNLLSVHASKGLEFKEVYLIDLMDKRFPNRKLISKGGSLEEERRLFYVATTRAKDILYLSYAKYDKIRKIKYEASPFLKEANLV